MAGENCTLFVQGYGTFSAVVTDISYSVEGAAEEAHAARYKVMYPLWMADTMFSVRFAFPTYQKRDAFNKWVRNYMNRLSQGQFSEYAAMRVRVPSRKFSRWGLPKGTLKYGDSVGETGTVYEITLTFVGATGLTSKKDTSDYRMAKEQTDVAERFYPAGFQKGGKESVAVGLFDVNGSVKDSLIDVLDQSIQSSSSVSKPSPDEILMDRLRRKMG